MQIVQEILAKVTLVPPLSHSLVRLMQLTGKPEHSLQEVTQLIGADAGLIANVLKVVNSAAFGAAQPINSLPMAVARLGERMVVGIAIGTCTGDFFKSGLDGYDGRRGELWKHSLRTAIASRELAKHAVRPLAPDLAYTAGLLHDLGKVILSDFLSGTASTMLAEVEAQQHPDFLLAERKQLGTDHCEIGYTLGMHWKLPGVLCEAMRYHHNPMASSEAERTLVFSVHGGDFVSMMLGSSTGVDALQYSLDSKIYDYIKLGPGAIERILLHVQDEYDKTVSSLLGETPEAEAI